MVNWARPIGDFAVHPVEPARYCMAQSPPDKIPNRPEPSCAPSTQRRLDAVTAPRVPDGGRCRMYTHGFAATLIPSAAAIDEAKKLFSLSIPHRSSTCALLLAPYTPHPSIARARLSQLPRCVLLPCRRALPLPHPSL
jgi:hypothetical protein